MLSWFLNPWMLLGSVAVASPILIHLLNKRRFKIVDWAAMEFLFEADKKNRRRVQVENFILLALRCLAMLLIAFMLARPFLPSSFTDVLQQSQKLERVFVIDDSLSQRVPLGDSTAFDQIKTTIKNLIVQYATTDKTEDWFTLIRTSAPDNPVLANEPLTANTLATISETVERLECTDRSADYSSVLNSVSRYLASQQESVGRSVYLFSDMRRIDWQENRDTQTAPNRLLNAIGKTIEGCYVIDTGNTNDQNLAVVSVRAIDFPISEKVIPFAVVVQNFSDEDTGPFRVLFQVNDGQPDFETVNNIPPGQAATVEFRYVFPAQSDDLLVGQQEGASQSVNYRIRAEIDRQSMPERKRRLDALTDDSESLFPARVVDGIPVLLVDGAPSAVSQRSETHYLRSLDVPGAGLKTTTVTASELETISLANYRVIFLCNVDEVSSDRVDSIRQWIIEGGGLVVMPGDRVRALTFNNTFYRDGAGLSPVKLQSIQGDPTLSQWVNFEVDSQIHPALEVVLSSEATSVSKIDVFSWWASMVDESQIGKTISVPLRLSNQGRSPAMVEKNLGKGRVVFFAFPADGDWSMWPTGATFVPITLGLIDDMVGQSGDQNTLASGSSIRLPVDVSIYNNRVSLTNPDGEKMDAVAAPVITTPVVDDPNNQPDAKANEDESASSVLYQAQFPPVSNKGFYEVVLQRNQGGAEPWLFAANVDTNESDLKRLPAAAMEGDFFSSDVALVSPNQLADQTVKGGTAEIWPSVLGLLFTALMLEQFLGWFWGRKR